MSLDLLSATQEVFQTQGWRIYGKDALTRAGFDFDLAAESESALVFARIVTGFQLGEVANKLAGEIASITLSGPARAKAWESYLLLFVSEGYLQNIETVQRIEYDFTFCRKVVVDVAEITQSKDSQKKLMSDLAFLFPLSVAVTDTMVDVRQMLGQRLHQAGVPGDVAADLVTHFDDENCGCVVRVNSSNQADIE
jgi:hypothetical protein